MGFASRYMAYSVPSTSTWCHLGGSYIHILYVFVSFCKMKACIIFMLYDFISIMDIDMDHLAGPNRQTPGKRERTSLP